jgi:hypothetical protein
LPVVAYAPRQARGFFEAAQPGTLLVPQAGADLGARMAHVFERLFARGFGAVVRGPTARACRYATRARPSAPCDAGPRAASSGRADAGYYLIGLRTPCPALFAGIAWSSERVLAQTRQRAQRAGRRLRSLPAWYDVDTIEDLRRLPAERRRGRGHPARTRRLLGTAAWRTLVG